jgi:hypothetical protein
MPVQQTVDSWVPKAVIDAANRLHTEYTQQGSAEGLSVLSRLISDRRMKNVWQLLLKKKRDDKYQSTEVFVHPASTLESRAANLRSQAYDLRRKGGESNELDADVLHSDADAVLAAFSIAAKVVPGFAERSASQEQDFAVRRFFDYACRAAVDVVPAYLSDINETCRKATAVSRVLREQTTQLEELGLFEESTKLNDIIKECDDLAYLQLDSIHSDDPAIISRKRVDPKLRAYVVELYKLSFSLFGTPLYGTLATTANVAFNCGTVTRQKVIDWLPRAL